MMTFTENIFRRARSDRKRIILPEGHDSRIISAAKFIIEEDIAELILLGDGSRILPELKRAGIDSSSLSVVEPGQSKKIDSYITDLHNLRRHKGVTLDDARQLVQDPIYCGMMMLKSGQADGLVAGADHSTSSIIRPALQIIKTAPGINTVSSTFFIIKGGSTYLFADCGLNVSPDSRQLADIALSTALTSKLFGLVPRIALLSYSTLGSSRGPDVDKIAQATRIAGDLMRDKYPGEYLLDGELQFDAASNPAVAAIKCPGSPLQGTANIFIFPDLDAGNIAYKIAQQLGEADTYGPILQGMAIPANDLSRGCSSTDIAAVVAITAIQAQALEE